MKLRNRSGAEERLGVLPLAREWIEITLPFSASSLSLVLPLAREWIEIVGKHAAIVKRTVLPLAREWIEIPKISPGLL